MTFCNISFGFMSFNYVDISVGNYFSLSSASLALVFCLFTRPLFDLLTTSCYLGALRAINKGYDVIVSQLLNLAIRRLTFDTGSLFPYKVDDVKKELELWKNRYSRYVIHV